jgi:hypothetical protein
LESINDKATRAMANMPIAPAILSNVLAFKSL